MSKRKPMPFRELVATMEWLAAERIEPACVTWVPDRDLSIWLRDRESIDYVALQHSTTVLVRATAREQHCTVRIGRVLYQWWGGVDPLAEPAAGEQLTMSV